MKTLILLLFLSLTTTSMANQGRGGMSSAGRVDPIQSKRVKEMVGILNDFATNQVLNFAKKEMSLNLHSLKYSNLQDRDIFTEYDLVLKDNVGNVRCTLQVQVWLQGNGKILVTSPGFNQLNKKCL